MVLDTCVIVSAIKSSTGASAVLVDLATQQNPFFQAILSEGILYQYEDVLYRPEHRVKGWTDKDLYALVQSLMVPADWAVTNFRYRPLLEDAGDELVLEAALNSQADYIATFNVKDFGPAEQFGIRVTTPGQLLSVLKEKGWNYGKE